MSINGDPVIAAELNDLKSKITGIETRISELRAISIPTANQSNEINSLIIELSQTSETYTKTRTQYLQTVPAGETPIITDAFTTDTTTEFAGVVSSLIDRDSINSQYQDSLASEESAETEIEEIQQQAESEGRTLTIEEQQRISQLNTVITNNQTLQSTLRPQILNTTNQTNTYNSTVVWRSNSAPRSIDQQTYNSDGTVNYPKTGDNEWNSDIQGTPAAEIRNITESNIVLNTTPEITSERQESYDRHNRDIQSKQEENAGLLADIEREQNLLRTAGDFANPEIVEYRQQRINNLQQRLDTNLETIETRTSQIEQMRINDSQREFARNNEILDNARTERSNAAQERRDVNRELDESRRALNDELKRPNPDPDEVERLSNEVRQNQSRYSQAEHRLQEADNTLNDVVKLRNDPDYYAERFREREQILATDQANTGSATSPGPTPTAAPDTGPQPYGSVNANDRQEWSDGTSNPPETQIWDTETGRFIDHVEMETYTGSGINENRYVYVRPGIDSDELNEQINQNLSDIQTRQDSEYEALQRNYINERTAALDAAKDTEGYKNLEQERISAEQEKEAAEQEIQNLTTFLDSGEWKGEGDAPTSEQAQSQLSEQQNTLSEAESKLNEVQSAQELIENNSVKSIDDAHESSITDLDSKFQEERESAVLFTQSASQLRPDQQPVTYEEAQALLQRQDRANEGVDRSEIALSRSVSIAQERCQLGGGTDCSNPDNWSAEDKERVEKAKEELDVSRQALRDANSAIATASVAPDGAEKLTEAGLTPEELEGLQAEAIDPESGRVDATADTGNESGDGLKPENVGRSPTGFEGINDGAPFYFQMPTMEAITDFRMKNGYSPYGPKDKDSIARDAVHFNIFELNPAAARADLSEDGSTVESQYKSQGANILGSFTVYPNNPDWLNLSHEHTWGGGAIGQIAEIANQGLNFIDSGQALLETVGNITASAAAGEVLPSQRRITRKVDVIDTYQSTNKLEIRLPFILFTKKDFLADVYRPLMFLTGLSYPKRMLDSNLSGAFERGQEGFKKFGEEQDGALGSLATGASSLLGSTQSALQPVMDKEANITRQGGFGPFRYFVSKRPEYLSMRHASGLIYFPMCYIQSISYNFKGPWYNYEGNPIDISKSSNSEIKAEESFRRALAANSIDPRNPNRMKIAAYPSMAEVTINIRNAMPFYRDDWMQLFFGANDLQNLINISVRQTGQGNLISPNGRSLTPPVGLNETSRDLFQRNNQTGELTTDAGTASSTTSSQPEVQSAQAASQNDADTRPAQSQKPNPGPSSSSGVPIIPEPPEPLSESQLTAYNAAVFGINTLSNEKTTIQDQQNSLLNDIQSGDIVNINTNQVDGPEGFADDARADIYITNRNRIDEIDIEIDLLQEDIQFIIGQ